MNDPSSQRIEPRTLKGFRDFLPEMMIPRERIIEIARRVYRSFGYAPIDTPALEYFEILAGKGGEESDRQLYHFHDHGQRHVGMRFDLTVPLARFVAQHTARLSFPFKRYHIATVWRGESPQAGRFREFMQCDFDTIGSESIACDVEMVLVINDLFTAIGFDRFEIRLNNRRVLNGLLTKFGLLNEATHVLRAIDKLAKIGPELVAKEIRDRTAADISQVESILQITDLRGSTFEMLHRLEEISDGQEQACQGIAELREVVSGAASVGIPENRIVIDPAIARGLDYYTGTIVETYLSDLPVIGSVCSGGRYDELATLFTKQHLPGIGASLGLDRLLAAMEELKLLPAAKTPAEVLIANFAAADLNRYLALAAKLRAQGLAVDVFAEPKKLAHQFKYADRCGFAAVIVAGPEELQSGNVQLKWLCDGSQVVLPLSNSAEEIANCLVGRLGKTVR